MSSPPEGGEGKHALGLFRGKWVFYTVHNTLVTNLETCTSLTESWEHFFSFLYVSQEQIVFYSEISMPLSGGCLSGVPSWSS